MPMEADSRRGAQAVGGAYFTPTGCCIMMFRPRGTAMTPCSGLPEVNAACEAGQYTGGICAEMLHTITKHYLPERRTGPVWTAAQDTHADSGIPGHEDDYCIGTDQAQASRDGRWRKTVSLHNSSKHGERLLL